MRLPRHDTSLSLPAEPPAAALWADEALLGTDFRVTSGSGQPLGDEALLGTDFRVTPSGVEAERSERACRLRLWVATSPAVVVGIGLRHRLTSIVDLERCHHAGVDVLERRAGGGALLLDEHMLCGAVALPISKVAPDVTESYRWLGDLLLGALDLPNAHRVPIDEARQDVSALRASESPVARVLLTTCYGALSPHEIVLDGRKLVGLAQVRRRDAALFQFGVLLRDQSSLADYLQVPDEPARADLRQALASRTVGLTAVTDRPVSAVASAIADAMPCAP
jgi:lipoate-protein ligase A